MKITVNSPNVTYTEDSIESNYTYNSASASLAADGTVTVAPASTTYKFKTGRKVPKTGVMLVGLGGNNGSTVVAACLANKHNICWNTKNGPEKPNFYGSITQASTVSIGTDPRTLTEVFVPFKDVLPMVEPTDIVWGGWDISAMNLADAMKRAQVLEYDLQQQLVPYMKDMVPLPTIFDADFVAANQQERADNVLTGTRAEKVLKVREHIREFKKANGLEKVIVLWTANTERYAEVRPGLNDTAANLLAAIERDESELSPSTLFAVACIQEGVPYINGSPQNTFVPGCMEMAIAANVPIAGDDFKSGQTKFKSVLADFLINAGIKPRSIVSYNHLGNNDGKNLSAPQTFRSKEISKAGVVEDMVESNHLLYPDGQGPDHCIVIKYVPYVADSKRAMDEYISDIFMGGHNTIVVHNTCEDSLLAAPIILDLLIMAELTTRISYKGANEADWSSFHPVLSILSFLCKAPLAPPGTPVVNALFRQRACIDNVFRACVGLPPEHNMRLETFAPLSSTHAARQQKEKPVPSAGKPTAKP